ncbi:MAG: DUF1287 domain-containing protein [Verrucomicrobiota bacterium]
MYRNHSFFAPSLILILALLTFNNTSAAPTPSAEKIVAAAKARIGVTKSYDPAYVGLDYPNGDVPNDRGVCTDVVVRSLRKAGIDLQKEVHEDMKANFSAYPNNWGLTRPDKNIDHRRVPNLMTFWKREGLNLPTTENPADYLPGDIVAVKLDNGLLHVVIVSDNIAAGNRRKIIHNIGYGTVEEDRLFEFTIIGHYRLKN